MLRQAAVSLSVGSKPPGEDTVGAKQGSRPHDVCTLTVPHCSSNMDSVCSGAHNEPPPSFLPVSLKLTSHLETRWETWAELRDCILDCSNSAALHCSPNSSCTWDPCVVAMVVE